MKRRSFLAWLGLAPIAAPSAAEAAASVIDWSKVDIVHADIRNISVDAISASWTCPDFGSCRAAALEAGLPEPRIAERRLVRVQPARDHCGVELHSFDEQGNLVGREWNKR